MLKLDILLLYRNSDNEKIINFLIGCLRFSVLGTTSKFLILFYSLIGIAYYYGDIK